MLAEFYKFPFEFYRLTSIVAGNQDNAQLTIDVLMKLVLNCFDMRMVEEKTLKFHNRMQEFYWSLLVVDLPN